MNKIYICKEENCNNKISYNTFYYGKGRCASCSQIERFKIKENHPMFGNQKLNAKTRQKYYCKKCAIEIDYKNALYGSGLCRSCTRIRNSGKNNGNYKDGRTLKEYKCIDCNKKVSAYSAIYGNCRCQSCAKIEFLKNPKNHPNWKNGITPLSSKIRYSEKYINWRNEIYKRDNYTCQECGQVGGQLHTHHIISFFKIFKEFLNKYSQYSPIEDKEKLLQLAINYKPFWNIDNGQTLCKQCHELTDNYKKRSIL